MNTYAAHLLKPPSADDDDDDIQLYNPFFLDDPNIKSGKHRVELNLPGYMSSIISFVKHSDLKEELNEKFRSRHEWIHPSMTLSKIRKIKRLLLSIGQTLDLELSTVALSYIYFERLCLRNIVTKQNRRIIAGVSLLLAYKYNEGQAPNATAQSYPYGTSALSSGHSRTASSNIDTHVTPSFQVANDEDGMISKKKGKKSRLSTSGVASLWRSIRGKSKNKLTTLMNKTRLNGSQLDRKMKLRALFDSIEEVLDVRRTVILQHEFKCFVELEFDLSVKPDWIMVVFKNVLNELEQIEDQAYLNVGWAM
jgi:hypothetical protein